MAGSGTSKVTSKPNFGVSKVKAGGAFAKPSYMNMGNKKVTGTSSGAAGPSIISKANINPLGSGPKMAINRRRRDEDFIENELSNIQQNV